MSIVLSTAPGYVTTNSSTQAGTRVFFNEACERIFLTRYLPYSGWGFRLLRGHCSNEALCIITKETFSHNDMILLPSALRYIEHWQESF